MKTRTTSILLFDVQLELLAWAAQQEGMNVSEYIREVVIPFVARRCNRPVPVTPRLSRRGSVPPPGESGARAIQDLTSALIKLAQAKPEVVDAVQQTLVESVRKVGGS